MVGIRWSHCGERFAFSMVQSLYQAFDSDIYVYDIKASTLRNLTDNQESLGENGRLIMNILPVWAEEDRGIYYARMGREEDGAEMISHLSFTTLETGEIETILDFRMEELLHIYPTLIYNRGVLFYDLIDPALGEKMGIYKYTDKVGEVLLMEGIRKEEDRITMIRLVDISFDGEKLLFKYQDRSFTEPTRFFLMRVDVPEQKEELIPNSPNGMISSVLFSPDGTTIMQIENDKDNGKSYVYVLDISDPTGSLNLIYTREDDFLFAWNHFHPIMQPYFSTLIHQLQPIWLDNSYIAINGEVPRLYRIVTTANGE